MNLFCTKCGTKLPSPGDACPNCATSQLGERIASGIDNTIGQLNKAGLWKPIAFVLAVTLTILVACVIPMSLPVLVVFIVLTYKNLKRGDKS